MSTGTDQEFNRIPSPEEMRRAARIIAQSMQQIVQAIQGLFTDPPPPPMPPPPPVQDPPPPGTGHNTTGGAVPSSNPWTRMEGPSES